MTDLYESPILSVADISAHIRHTLESQFPSIRVRGEIGTFTRAASGHLYFSLKDSTSKIDCICWKMTVPSLSLDPGVGMTVIAYGRITTYDQRSSYQLIVEQLELDGVGAYYARLEALKKKLLSEGLFDESRKRPLPTFPKSLGIITSSSGAVFHDMQHRLADRYPLPVVFISVPVQGTTAAPLICKAIARMNALDSPPDVLILARGGGSVEDLSAFNEEILVRAFASSAIPTISAIGHETDFTLADFAADKRAPTPTAAIEFCTPDRFALLQTLDTVRQSLDMETFRLFNDTIRQLDHMGLALASPIAFLEGLTKNITAFSESLAYAGNQRLLRFDDSHRRLADLLISLNPSATLQKGYTFVVDSSGMPIMRAAAMMDETYSLHFHDGIVPIRRLPSRD